MGAQKSQKVQKQEQEPSAELRERKTAIIHTWKERVQNKVLPVQPQKEPALVDSMPAFVDRLIEAMANSRSEREKAFQAVLTASAHGEQRAHLPNYTLDQVLIEYRILREVIFDVLRSSQTLTESAVDSIDDSIQVGMSAAATEFLRLRMIREAEARQEVESLNKRLRGLQSVTDGALARTPAFHELLHDLLGRVREIFRCDTVVILLLDDRDCSLVVRASHGLEGDVHNELRIPAGKGVAGKIFSEGKPLNFDDLSKVTIYNPLLRKKNLGSLMGAPLRTNHGILGVILIGSLDRRRFSDDELLLLQMISDRIAVAIENSRLYEQSKSDVATLELAQTLGKRFLSILTHDIRDPMDSARLLASMLRKRSSQLDLVRTLSLRISQALGRSDKLIQDLLDVNRIMTCEPLSLEPENLNLRDIIAESLVPLTLLYGDRFIFQNITDIEGHWSRRELSRIFDIALEMGVRFGKCQSPILITAELEGQGWVKVVVQFDATMTPPLSLETDHLSEKDEVQIKYETRIGLNWTLIKAFTEAHQGQATFESSEEIGTQITIKLPLEPKNLSKY